MTLRHGQDAPVATTEPPGGAGLVSEPLQVSSWRGAKRCWTGLVLACLGVGAFSGAAAAYWNTHGNGSASALTGTMAPVSVIAFTGGDTPSSSLLPGGSSDVVLRVSNPNSYAVTLTAISVDGSISATGGIGTCSTPGISTNFPSSPSIAVPAGSNLIHLSGAATMSAGASNGCQGATFGLPVSVSFQR
jgi:hypothetical protein